MPKLVFRYLVAVLCISTCQIFIPAYSRAVEPYESAYQEARKAFYRFKDDKEKQKFRHNWQFVAKAFESVANKYPDSPRAPDALYTAGRLYYDLYAVSRLEEDLRSATTCFRTLVEKYSQNYLADDAQLYIALQSVEYVKNTRLARKELAYLIEHFPKGDITPKATRMLEDLGGPPEPEEPISSMKAIETKPKPSSSESEQALLERVKHWSNPDYTRIVLYTRTKITYKSGQLPKDDANGLPARLYIDLLDTELGSDLTDSLSIRDSIVKRVRMAKRQGGFIRVVVEMDQDRSHRIFPMDDPARVVLDVVAKEDKKAETIGIKPVVKKPVSTKRKAEEIKKKSHPGASLSMLAGLRVKRIVIDPGHGGNDTGAIGPTGLLEKDVVLDIGRKLKKIIMENMKVQVTLTRNKDVFLELEERTAIANKLNADLFVSIHNNAHINRKYYGVETFYLDLTDDKYSIKLAARENATSEKTISDLDKILADLALKSHVDDSIALSGYVQKGMVGTLRRKHKDIKDLGLKPALFYVLIGARMPSILVEASFISNYNEEKRLRTSAYRQELAKGIYHGIKNFIQERNEILGME